MAKNTYLMMKKKNCAKVYKSKLCESIFKNVQPHLEKYVVKNGFKIL